MAKVCNLIYALILSLSALNSYAWNAVGHKVVAQIAYDHLSPQAKKLCAKYLNSRNPDKLNSTFVGASIWMDQIRFKKIYWYDGMHYIDIPFSNDDSPLPAVDRTNAIRALQQATNVLSSRKTNASDKKLALRMLIHITGDIHQPLHTATQVSARHPKGDLGGNLFLLGKNPVGGNLHKYWDNGAGFFLGKYNEKKIKNTARQIEHDYPCSSMNGEMQVAQWAKASHQLALAKVYQTKPHASPSKQYQYQAQQLIKRQVAYAGCRLGMLLNQIAEA